jgi:ribosomal protein S18 acetylase RimI-like enzyme
LATAVGAAKRADLAEVELLFAKVLEELRYNNALSKEHEAAKYSVKALQKKLAGDRYSILVAKAGRDNNKVIGFCFNHFDDFTIWIEWFGVATEERRKGVGQALLKQAFVTARKRGAHKVWCDCRTTNQPSYNVLTKSGFRQIATVKNHWYGQDFILWERFV